MRKAEIREVRAEDAPALIRLWCRVFEDPEALPAAFLRLLPELGGGVAAFADGELAGAAYIVTALTVGARRAAYLYAVAVHPAYRGRGLGRALTREAAALGRRRGADFVCTLPAGESLYGWYERLLGTRCALYRREERFPARPGCAAAPIAPADFNARREALLAGLAHLGLSEAAAALERVVCRAFGGDLYAVGDGICAAYRQGAEACVRELLCPDLTLRRAYAESVGAAMGCESVVLLSPGTPGDAPFLAAEPGALTPDCVWDLAFD